MKKIALVILLVFCYSELQAAPIFAGDLKVNRLWVGATEIIFGFKSTPAGCIDREGYHNAHAVINVANNPLYKEQLSILLTAMATGKSVDIWAGDLGDCKIRAELLTVNTIGLTAEE